MSIDMDDLQAKMDAAAIREYGVDLRDMTLRQTTLEIERAEDKIADEESWLEALVAWRRKLIAEGATS